MHMYGVRGHMEPGSQNQARTGRLKECLFLRGLCDDLCSRFMGSKHLWAGLSAISALLALDNAAGFLLHPAGSGRSGKEPRPSISLLCGTGCWIALSVASLACIGSWRVYYCAFAAVAPTANPAKGSVAVEGVVVSAKKRPAEVEDVGPIDPRRYDSEVLWRRSPPCIQSIVLSILISVSS